MLHTETWVFFLTPGRKAKKVKDNRAYFRTPERKAKKAAARKATPTEVLSAQAREQYLKNLAWHMVHSAKRRAGHANRPFSLTRQDVSIPERCPVFGQPLEVGEGKQHLNSPTLDRIDSTKGYTPDNVWVISLHANRLKNSASLLELCQLSEAVASVTPLQELVRLAQDFKVTA